MIQDLFGHSDCSYYDCVGNGPGTLKHLLLVMKWMLSSRLALRCKTRTKCSNCWQYVCGHLERRAKEFLELMLNNFSIAGIWSVWFVSDPCLHRLPSLQTLSVPLWASLQNPCHNCYRSSHHCRRNTHLPGKYPNHHNKIVYATPRVFVVYTLQPHRAIEIVPVYYYIIQAGGLASLAPCCTRLGYLPSQYHVHIPAYML